MNLALYNTYIKYILLFFAGEKNKYEAIDQNFSMGQSFFVEIRNLKFERISFDIHSLSTDQFRSSRETLPELRNGLPRVMQGAFRFFSLSGTGLFRKWSSLHQPGLESVSTSRI